MTAMAARMHLPSERNKGSVPAFLAALVMHAALIGSMWFAVQWKTAASAPASAELWELPSVEQTTPLPTPTPAPAPETPTPAPAQEAPTPAPDIAIKHERARKTDEEPPKVPPKKEKEKKPKTTAEPTARELKRQQAEADRRHAEELKRLSSQAGEPSQTPALASAGPISNEWTARIISAVRANLSFAVPEGVSPSVYAEFEVELLPDGEQAAEPRLLKSSGLPGFDEAARRAIMRTDPFPRMANGKVQSPLTLDLHPQDVR